VIAEVDWTGLATFVTALGVLVAAWRGSRTLKRVEGITSDTNTIASQVNHAVNGKPAGESSISTQVQDMHDQAFPGSAAPVGEDAVLPILRELRDTLATLAPNGGPEQPAEGAKP